MNQHSSTDSSISSPNDISAEAVSRRAYEIWEREGRPEGRDLRHWLEAEQELSASRGQTARPAQASNASRPPESAVPRNSGSDTKPLQGTRAGAAASRDPNTGRDAKRTTSAPFGAEKNGAGSMSGQNAAKRKPAAAPVL